MMHRIPVAVLVISVLSTLMFAGCKPGYPHCESDDNCAEQGQVCLNGQCQECRDSATCLAKYPQQHRVCKDGRCQNAPECSLDADCAAVGLGLICKNEKCQPECTTDGDCTGKRRCAAQRCVATCTANTECRAGESCVGGLCQGGAGAVSMAAAPISDACQPHRPGDSVQLDAVEFEFNKYELTGDARDQLSHVLTCLQQAPATLYVTVEGHCDDRGTQEYNLALGEKRANAVYTYFKQMGLEPKRFVVRSKGENEPVCTDNSEACFAKNRRVQFLQAQH